MGWRVVLLLGLLGGCADSVTACRYDPGPPVRCVPVLDAGADAGR